jgi:hypothetical protein
MSVVDPSQKTTAPLATSSYVGGEALRSTCSTVISYLISLMGRSSAIESSPRHCR